MNATWNSQATFEVLYTRFLNEQGQVEQPLPEFAI